MTRMSKRSIFLIILFACAIGYCLVFILSNRPLFCVPGDGLAGWLAIGLGLGYVPLIPGTAGALGGVIFSVASSRLLPWAQVLVAAALVAVAVPLCEYGSLNYGGIDDPRIVADELLAFPVATVALPIRHHPVLLACVFTISRMLDAIKPFPADTAELLPGGMGIVLDDVVTNAWTLLFGLIGWRWYQRRSKV